MGATVEDMRKLAQVWDGVLRSVLGCSKFGFGALFRAEAGWPSFKLMAAKHVVMYFSRVKQMLPDQDAKGELHARPVKTMLEDTIDRQTGRWSTTAKPTPTGLRYSTAITQFFRQNTDKAPQGAIGSAAQWDDAIAGCMRRAIAFKIGCVVPSMQKGSRGRGAVLPTKGARDGCDVQQEQRLVQAHSLEGGVTCAGE